jgi:hypothetical protein
VRRQHKEIMKEDGHKEEEMTVTVGKMEEEEKSSCGC